MSAINKEEAQANKVIGETLRRIRLHNGISQERLAKRIHATQAKVSRIENGKRSLRLFDAFTIAVGNEMHPHDLYVRITRALEAADVLDVGPWNDEDTAAAPGDAKLAQESWANTSEASGEEGERG